MPDNLTDLGAGPYGVEFDEPTGFHFLTQDGARTGKTYPLGKTANRAARKLNEAHQGEVTPLETARELEDPESYLEDAPIEDRATAKRIRKGFAAAPKAPKAKRVRARLPVLVPKAALPDEPKKTYEGSREEWLNAFIAAARPVFKKLELELPEKIRASVGFMFRGGKAIGQCWHEAASTDGTREIFVIPTLDDSYRIADVLTHELAHTLFGPDEKHGKNFKAAVTKLGLEGKATATVAGPGWLEWASPILEELGSIPHARLDPTLSGVKKQKTYLLKCECEDCGLIFRATAKALTGKVLRCTDAACDGSVKVDGAEDLGEGDGE